MARPALFVVKATIAPDREAEFNEWYNTRRAAEAAAVPGLLAMRRYAPVTLDVGAHPGAEPWQYMVVYEFESEEALRAFAASGGTLRWRGRAGPIRVQADLPVAVSLSRGVTLTPVIVSVDSGQAVRGRWREDPGAAISPSWVVHGSHVL